MLSALARALQAVGTRFLSRKRPRPRLTRRAREQEKEVNRLKDRLYEAQQQLEIWRAKAMTAAPPILEPAAAANPFEPQRLARPHQPVARPRPEMTAAARRVLPDVPAGLGGAMEN
jgi:hypothetical protein